MKHLVLPLFLLAGVASAQNVSQTTTRLDPETIRGIAESTDRYIPQIQERVVIRLQNPENPFRRGLTDPGGPNNMPVGGLLNEPRGKTLARFPGITFTGWNPPDPTVACGPTSLVATVNSSMAFFSKAGSKTFEVSFDTFFSSLSPGSFIFDPKVFYDVHAKRFVVAVLEEDDATSTSKVLFAVSDDSDPTGTWFKYRLEAKATVGGTPCWGDYPGFGYNKDGYAIALNMFSFSPGSFEGVQIMTLPKAAVLTGGAATVSKFIDTAADSFTLQVAEGTNPTSDKLFLINAATTTKLKLWTMSGLSGVPAAPTTQIVTVPTYEFPPSSGAPSPSGRLLDELDGRLINAVYRGTTLVTTHGVILAADARNRARWYEIATTGGAATFLQSGEVKETTAAATHFYMPSISKNAAGDIAMVMTKSSATGPVADIVRTARKSADAVGAMGTPVVLKSSGGATYGSSGFNRWGDYSAVCVDPADNGTFWVIHMTGDSGSNWTTEISSFAVSPVITSITPPATITGGGSAVTLSYTTNVAPAVPTSVFLSSSNGSLASVPASTTLAGGATSGTFSVGTPTGVNSDTAVNIVATINGVAFTKSITIKPANISNLTLNFSTIAANQSVIGTVTLLGKAGPAGRVVTLSSSAPIAVVGPTMTVAGGATTGKFGISTANTSTIKTSDITATLGTAVTKTLTVIPSPVLSSLEIAGTKTVVGGVSTSCLVRTLTPAPAGGARAKLSETSAFVDPNVYANIAEGLKVGSATIRTSPVATIQIVVITARMNGVTKTDTLTVTP